MIYVLLGVALVLLWLLAGASSGRGIRIGPVIEDLEADLRPLHKEGPTWMARGKAHRERYEDGRETFELRCDGLRHGTGELRLPVAGPIEVVLGDVVLASVPMRQGRVQMKLRSDRGDRVPPVEEGTRVALRYGGACCWRGRSSGTEGAKDIALDDLAWLCDRVGEGA